MATEFSRALSRSVEREVVAIHKFLLNFGKGGCVVHLFLEGRVDESFYGTHVRRFASRECRISAYVCGSKRAVYRVLEKTQDKRRDGHIKLFFVDKDLDDVIENDYVTHDSLWVTEYYSIENYLVSEDLLEQIFAEIYRMSSGNEIIDEVVSRFSKSLSEFSIFMTLPMAWILYQRRLNKRLNLSEIRVRDIIHIDDELNIVNKISQDGLINAWAERYGIDYSAQEHVFVGEISNELAALPAKDYLRGHFEMEFFIIFIRMAKTYAERVSKEPIRCSLDIGEQTAVDLLGPRVRTPPRLTNFLEMHLLDPALPLSLQ